MLKIFIVCISFSSFVCMADVSLVPQPQEIELGKILELSNNHVKIIYPDKFPAAQLAKAIMAEKLKAPISRRKIEVKLKYNDSSLKDNLYTIDYSTGKDYTTVNITGGSNRALFNGIMTLNQLITAVEKDKIKLQLARIKDYPIWKNRYSGDYGAFSAKSLKAAARYKFNGLAFQYRHEWHTFDEDRKFGKFKTFKEAFGPMKTFVNYDVLDFMFIYNIYSVRGKRKRPMFNIASKKDMDNLIKRCKFIARSGFSHIMIAADDWTPMVDGMYVAPSREEQSKFGKCASNAHRVLMRQLQAALKPSFPELELSFCPPVYALAHAKGNEKHRKYLQNLVKKLPKDIAVVWTGPGVVSQKITENDYKEFSNYIAGHKTFIWDNSEVYVYPVHSWKSDFFNGLEKVSSGILINTQTFSFGKWKMLFSINANDYLWNPKAYNNSISYEKAFKSVFPAKYYKLIDCYQKNYEKLLSMTSRNYNKQLLDKLKQQKKKIDKLYNNRSFNANYNRLVTKLETKLPTASVQLIGKAPIIDGIDDDDCYKDLKKNLLLQRYGQAVPKSSSTTYKFCFDREAMYFFIKANLSKPLPEKNPPLLQLNDLFSRPDVLEIFIAPGPGRKNYIQLAVDFEGNKFNALRGKRNWSPKWELAVKRTKEYWTAELKIPFKMMKDANGSPPVTGTQWRGNITREYNYNKMLQCWSPTYANRFLDSQMFGYFQFAE